MDRSARKKGTKTRRRETGDMLWRSMELFRTLVDTLGHGVSIMDDEERFYMVNPAGERIFGVEQGTLAGKSVAEFVEVDTFGLIQRHNELRKKGETTSYDIVILRPDGEKRLINITAAPIFDHDRNLVHTLGIFRDITEERRDQEELDQLRNRFSEELALRTAELEATIRRLEEKA
jgi:PAS domain S-box-containing protein